VGKFTFSYVALAAKKGESMKPLMFYSKMLMLNPTQMPRKMLSQIKNNSIDTDTEVTTSNTMRKE